MTASPAPRRTSSTPSPDSVAPADDAADAPEEKPAAPALSLTQVVASALAAVSATVLLSYFGIAGTIIGAGAASVISVLGNYAYTRSIQKTREQLKPVMTQLVQAGAVASRPRGSTTATLPTVPRDGGTQPLTAVRAGSTQPLTTVRTGAVVPGDGPDVGRDDGRDGLQEPARPGPWFRLIDRHGRAKVLTVSAVALFVVVMGVVLVAELVIGKPISDAVRGQEGSGTTLSRTTTDDGTQDVVPSQEQPGVGTTPAPEPSTVPSEEAPSVPADEPQPAPSPTDEPTDDPTGTPSPEPTDPATPGTGEDGTEDTGDTDGSGTGTGTDGSATDDGTGSGTGATAGAGTGDGAAGTTETGQSSGSTAQPAPVAPVAPGA